MHLALTGTTSGLGIRLCEMLLGQGHTATGLVRDASRADARRLASLGVNLIEGHLGEPAALDAVAKHADAFVHLAAMVGDWGLPEAFVRVNVGGTRAAIEAAARSGVGRFVHLSSIAVYGRPAEGRVDETWPTKHARLPYEDTKTDAERLAFRRGGELGLEVVAIRPPVIYGPHDRNFMPRAVDALRKGRFVFVEGGRAPLNMVWVDHVVDVVLLAAQAPGIAGEAFNVMDEIEGSPPTVRQVANAIAEEVGAPLARVSLPFPLALAVAHGVEAVWTATRRKTAPPLTPFIIETLSRHVVFDASKVVESLGFRPRRSSLEGLRAEAKAFAEREKALGG